MRVTRNRSLRAVINEDGGAILDTEQGRIHTLNSTGGAVWRALEQGATVEEIVRQISDSSGAPVVVVERDVLQFLRELKKSQLDPRLREERP